MKKQALILAVILVAGLIFASCGKTTDDSELFALEASSADLHGNEIDDSVLAGKKLTMINVWATFCSPCINEMPDLAELNTEYADQGFQIIGIVADVTNRNNKVISSMLETAKTIVEQTGADYLHILLSDELNNSFLSTVHSLPTTIFVDENGNQVGEEYIGSRSKEKWAEIIESLLEQVS